MAEMRYVIVNWWMILDEVFLELPPEARPR